MGIIDEVMGLVSQKAGLFILTVVGFESGGLDWHFQLCIEN